MSIAFEWIALYKVRVCVKIMAKRGRKLRERHHEKTYRLYTCYFISLDSICCICS